MINNHLFSLRNSFGLKTPTSVIIPVINSAGVTSNDGFQTPIPSAAIWNSLMCVISLRGRSSILISLPVFVLKSIVVIGAAM